VPVILLAAVWANAQSAPVTGFLTRIQRVREREDVCVLVAQDGNYRLEKRFPNSTRVYVGLLSPSELQGLESVLENGSLKRIAQNEIPQTLVSDSRDMLLVDVYRQDSTQRLIFSGGDSRTPFREALDPVTAWFANLQKTPHAEISESSASHCYPASGSASPVSQLPFILLFVSNHTVGGRVETNCVMVYPDGRYQRERKTQEMSLREKPMKIEQASGKVASSELKQLTGLLDSEPIVSMQHTAGPAHWSTESEITLLSIPRAGGTQELEFANEFGVRGDPYEVGGASGLAMAQDPQNRAIEPVRRWLKKVQGTKLVEVASPATAGCGPSN
jgi:hypothetical protein